MQEEFRKLEVRLNEQAAALEEKRKEDRAEKERRRAAGEVVEDEPEEGGAEGADGKDENQQVIDEYFHKMNAEFEELSCSFRNELIRKGFNMDAGDEQDTTKEETPSKE